MGLTFKNRLTLIVLSLIIVIVGLGLILISHLFVGTYIPLNCITIYGYPCNPTYYASTGNLSITIEQNTHHTWTGWAIAYTSNDTSEVPKVMFVTVPTAPTLPSLISVNITGNTIVILPANVSIGAAIHGYLWVCYTTGVGVTGMSGELGACSPQGNTTATVKYVKIANFTAKAV